MHPRPRPGSREGMNAASGTARNRVTGTWDEPEQSNTPRATPGSRTKQETPVTHARQTRGNRKTPAHATLDTTPLLQG
jgi:hypothetical protein